MNGNMKPCTKQPNPRNRGFTLVELSIAIVLIALVGLLGVTVTLLATRSQGRFRLDARSQTELSRTETLFKDWLMRFDSSEYTLTVSPEKRDTITATATSGTEYTMKFQNGVLTCMTGEGETTEALEAVESVAFSASGKIFCCEVKLRQESEPFKILYTMRAANVPA